MGWFEWDKLYAKLDMVWGTLSQQLDRVENKITRLLEGQMAQAQQAAQINASLDDLNVKTDEAAARLKEIMASLHAGMTQEEVDAVVARIDAQATKLSGWGVNADDPLPVPA